MPNQLAQSKRRISVAEHKAVLAATMAISRYEKTTVVALMREAIRDLVKRRAANPAQTEALRSAVWKLAPRIVNARTPSKVARFKREQRAFDQVVLDLQLAEPAEIEARNSIAHPDYPIRKIDLSAEN